jgi:hypothetical protein
LQPSHAAMMSVIIAAVSYVLIRITRKLLEKDVKLA